MEQPKPAQAPQAQQQAPAQGQAPSNTFVDKLKAEIVFIRSYIFPRLEAQQKEDFQQLEKIYESIVAQINSRIVLENQAPQIYGSFLKTLKKFKRLSENNLKFNERDVDSFRKKWETTNRSLLPIVHDIKMNVSERMGKFDISKVKDPNFQMNLYSNKELCDIAFQMFEHQGFYKDKNIDPKQIQGLLRVLCLNYNVVPYHNWTHAFSLFQMFYCCYYQSSVSEFLDPFDFFSGMWAGLAHDLNHKGVNNLYKIKKKAETSRRYCEQGVLENMHVSTYFRLLLENPDVDFTKKLGDAPQIAQYKRITISAVLATDMGKHNKYLAKIKQRGEATVRVRNAPNEATEIEKYFQLKRENFEDRRLIASVLVHACDIGNPCLEFNNYMNWSYLVSQEFFDQTLKEEQNGLDVTMMLKYKDKLTFLNGQTFFSKVLVLPLWQSIADIFPNLKIYPESIEKNLKRIDEEKAKLQGQN